ncbi:hypothetical protein QR680_014255 [Steinernema hermaphroditum]|uniref:Uncharacterized protein n=1 Tax=Steinernema hermaphroditum TaxID=289476 RepID=A0AA39M3X1_9BILA|nr:hypothetical protein QR680_014255 [Steinernema hermaphroditum]
MRRRRTRPKCPVKVSPLEMDTKDNPGSQKIRNTRESSRHEARARHHEKSKDHSNSDVCSASRTDGSHFTSSVSRTLYSGLLSSPGSR